MSYVLVVANERYIRDYCFKIKSILFPRADVICRCWRTSRPGTFTNPGTRRSVYSTLPSASSARNIRCRWWTTARARASTSSGWNRCTSSWISIAVTVSKICPPEINFATQSKLFVLSIVDRRRKFGSFGVVFNSNRLERESLLDSSRIFKGIVF